jgi:hypothetical protein
MTTNSQLKRNSLCHGAANEDSLLGLAAEDLIKLARNENLERGQGTGRPDIF